MVETERKFIVSNPPNLSSYPSIVYERYYLPSKEGEEVRIQKKGDTYELEHKVTLSGLSRETTKQTITEAEYQNLKQKAGEGIERESYDLGKSLTIKVYKGRFSGLIRAEQEFANEEEAASYHPESWFGQEITHTPLGRDGQLIRLSDREFKDLLSSMVSSVTR